MPYTRERLELHIDYKSTFLEVLQKENSVTIHHRNLKALATDIFKAKNDIGPGIIEPFELKEPSFGSRSQGNYFVRGNVKSTHCGIQSRFSI